MSFQSKPFRWICGLLALAMAMLSLLSPSCTVTPNLTYLVSSQTGDNLVIVQESTAVIPRIQWVSLGDSRSTRIPSRVQNRINVTEGRTRFTPIRPSTGQPVAAGMEHVRSRHYGGTNNQSQFTIPENQLRGILQDRPTIQSPVTSTGVGAEQMFVRTVNMGQVVGTTRVADSANPTTWIRIYTDPAGNLITTFPVPAP